MIELDLLTDKTIVITTKSIKEKLLIFISKSMPITDIKIMTKQELINDMYFSYSTDILYYMSNKYNKNIDVCKNILDNLMFIDQRNYLEDLRNNKKINEYESIIKKYKKIILFDINLDEVYIEKIAKINKNIEIIKYNSKINNSNKSYVIEKENIEDEVMFVFDKILELITNKVDINNIKLIVPDDEYQTYIDDYSKLYNIKINTNRKTPLYSYNLTKSILNEYKNNVPLEEIIKKYEYNNNNLIDKIINIINKYDYKNDIYDVLKYEFKNNYLDSKKYTNAVDIVNIDDCYIDNETYLFVLGFNQNIIPRIYKDDDFIKDEEKEQLKLFTSKDKNINEKEYIKNLIKKSKETYITYKLKTPYNIYLKSSLLDELNVDTFDYIHNYKISPSKSFDKYASSKMIDDVYKIGKKDDNLKILLPNINNDYMLFDNSFKGLSKTTIDNLIKDELNLSYTSINSFYECKFKYFLKYLLRIKENSSNVNSLFLGNLFHYVLQNINKPDFNIDELINEYLNKEEKNLSKKEEVYLKKYKNIILELIDIIKENNKRSSFKDLYYEKEIVIEDKRKINIKFTGKIDKILSFTDEEYTYLMVIDYKTGTLKKDYNNIVYGLNMQLFTYIYLLNKENKKDNIKIAGMYLQNIGHELIKKEDKKTKEEQLKDLYSLYGYTLENTEIAKKIDNDLSSLKNISINKDDTFSSKSLLFNDALYNKFIEIVDEKIENAKSEILDGNYEIDPKELKDENISCKFCKYYDICYKKYRDIKVLKKMTIEEYETGDNSGLDR